MQDLDELKRRKEYLELQKEIDKLERKKRVSGMFGSMPQWLAVVLLMVGGFLFLVGVDEGDPVAIVIAIPLAIPFIFKKFFNG